MQYKDADWRAGPVSLDGVGQVIAQFDYHYRWNGWLCPALDAWSVVKVLTEINASYDEEEAKWYGYDWEWLDDGKLSVQYRQWKMEYPDEAKPDILEPDEDGLYHLGTYEWTWSEDHDYGCTEEWAAWAKRYGRVYIDAANESNRRLIASGIGDRNAANEDAGRQAVTQWRKDNPEPPKYPNGDTTWRTVPGAK